MIKHFTFSLRSLFHAAICCATALISAQQSMAQCADTAAPMYSSSCSNEYFSSLTVYGSGVSSTAYLAGIFGCRGTYINDYPYLGTTAPAGASVSMDIAKPARYAAYLTVFIDWNNNGSYETTEQAGARLDFSDTSTLGTYHFTVPASGAVAHTHLHMRAMLSEDSTGAPCTASYGQTYDFFFIVDSGCTMPVLTLRPSTLDSVGRCPGGVGVNLGAAGAGATGTYTWSPALGLSATTGTIVAANPDSTTVYTITATSTGTCTATATDTVVVFNASLPVDSISYVGSTALCPGGYIILTGTTGPGYRYAWLVDGMASRSRGNIRTVTAAGTYQLIINAYGCQDTSAAVVVTMYAPPAPVITVSGNILSTSSTFSAYQWFENGNPVAGATRDTLIATSGGSYNVLVTDSHGCTDTASVNILLNLGVENVNAAAELRVFPNPAQNYVEINTVPGASFTISGLDGRILLTGIANRKTDIAAIPNGVYVINCFDATTSKIGSYKLVKQ